MVYKQMKGVIPLQKKVISLLLVLATLFTCPLHSKAESLRASTVWPSLSFNGTTAQCSVSVTADKMSDSIEIVVKLWRNNICIKTWENSGIGYLIFNKSTIVTKGYTYILTADVTLDGVTQPTVSVSKFCK